MNRTKIRISKLLVTAMLMCMPMGIAVRDNSIVVKATSESEAKQETVRETILKPWIADNITDDMSDLEKITAITRYVSEEYAYDGTISYWEEMALNGGGDCWASTDMVIEMCSLINIRAWSRDASKDGGTGVNHMVAMTQIGEKYYQMDAGYIRSAHSTGMWEVKEVEGLWGVDANGYLLVYNGGADSLNGSIELPKVVNGVKVKGIAEDPNGQKFFRQTQTGIKELIIPEGYEKIGNYALRDLDNVESVVLPSTMTDIGYAVFGGCNKLTKFEIAKGNTKYKTDKKGETIRNIGMDTVYYIAGGLDTYTTDEQVRRIDNGAANGTGIKKVVITENVEEIGEYSFADITNCLFDLTKSTAHISSGAFYGIAGGAVLGSDTITSIDEGAFTFAIIISPRDSALYTASQEEDSYNQWRAYLTEVKNVKATSEGKNITIRWDAVDGATGYRVWVKEQAGGEEKYICIDETTELEASYEVNSYNQVVTVGIEAFHDYQDTEKSETTVVIEPEPAPPAGDRCEITESTIDVTDRITLKYNDSGSGEIFSIYQKKTEDGKPVLMERTLAKGTTVKSLAIGKPTWIAVVQGSGLPADSDFIKVLPAVQGVQGLKVSKVSNGKATITWRRPVRTTGYSIKVKTSENGSWTSLGNKKASVTSIKVDAKESDKLWVSITSFNAYNESAPVTAHN